MIDQYFVAREVRDGFEKEFVSLFDGWLGEANLHRLDEVKELEWQKFNTLLRMLAEKYEILAVDLGGRSCCKVSDVESIIPTYEEDMNRESDQFTRIIIPELDAVFVEDWDYTWILWHREPRVVHAFAPMIANAGLFHFCEREQS